MGYGWRRHTCDTRTGSMTRADPARHGPGPPGFWFLQERVQEQVQVRAKASFIHVEKNRD